MRSRIYRISKISQDLQDFAGCSIIKGKLILGFLTNERGGADAVASLFYFYGSLLMADKGEL